MAEFQGRLLEFLLELGEGGSKKEFCAELEDIIDLVKDEIRQHFCLTHVVLDGLSTSGNDEPSANSFILQRWSTKWNEFVDVTSLKAIEDKDKLKVVLKTEPKSGIARAISSCSEIAKPKESHAKYLSSLFPGSSYSLKPSSSTFDPTREASNFRQKLKKKGSIRAHPFKLWVVIGKELFTSIPKASLRRSLNKSGRIKKVEFRRSMSEKQVQNKITQEFPHLQLDNPTFMKCVDSKIVCINVAGSGYPDGVGIMEIASRGSVYLVETSPLPKQLEVASDSSDLSAQGSDSSDGHTSPKRSAGTTKELLKRVDNVLVNLQAKPSYLSDDDSDASKGAHQESLEDWRRIREEQDKAYEESLAIDAKKVEVAEENSMKLNLLRDLCHEFEKKNYTVGDGTDGISLSFRFSCGRLDHIFPSTTSVKELYQFVMLKAKLEEPFTIYRVLPRAAVVLSDTSLLSLNVGGNLLTYEVDTYMDFFKFFRDLRDTVVIVSDDEKFTCKKKIGQWVDKIRSDEDIAGWSDVLTRADTSRKDFVTAQFKGKVSLRSGHVKIKRKNIYSDAIALYSGKPTIVNRIPISVQFEEEDGVDFGGICRDFFSGFWEEAYLKMFDGATLLTPACHADIDIKINFLFLVRFYPMATFVVDFFPHGYLSLCLHWYCCGCQLVFHKMFTLSISWNL